MRARALLPWLLLSALPACHGPDPWFRHPAPREPRTIFSPLDLPAPNGQRTGSGAPGPEYWQQQVDYAIEATLDPPARTLTGAARVTYHNNSPDTLEYLWLHLEQNSFRDDGQASAVAARRPDGTRRGGSEGYTIRARGGWCTPRCSGGSEGYTIRHVRDAAGAPLELVEHDLVARLALPAPLPPGARFEFDIGWSFQVPEKVFRRFGIETVEQGEVFELAQWFPCVAAYDDVHGWNTLPYLGSGEFYTPFGDYDVQLTVPRDHLVVATGVQQNPQQTWTAEQLARWERARRSTETVVIRGADEVADPASRPAGDGPLTWHFKAARVRTFAFAASQAFLVDAASLEGTPESTLCLSAYPKEALPLWSRSTQMLRAAMAGFNRRWFPYPWPVMTNVSGPEGGMEYPMIIFCGGRRSERGLYGVTAHELGHQWFPMLVNSDERRHAWMDEGFNTFIDHYADEEWFTGPEHAEANRGGRAVPAGYAPAMLQPDLLPIDTPPDRLPRGLVSSLQYAKTAAGLVLLREQVLGPERFDFAFRTYIRRWAFKSPRPADFYRCMEDAAGADLSWFWRGWFQETGFLDVAVGEVQQPEPLAEEQGVTTWGPSRVTIENLGELVMPVVLRVTFEGGEQRTVHLPVEIWATTNRFTEPFVGGGRIVEVQLDPEQVFPDVRRENDTWRFVR